MTLQDFLAQVLPSAETMLVFDRASSAEATIRPGDALPDHADPWISLEDEASCLQAVTADLGDGGRPSIVLRHAEGEVRHVYLLDAPVPLEALPEALWGEVPLPVGGWRAEWDGTAPLCRIADGGLVPAMLNDAEIIGRAPADIDTYLHRPVTFLTGKLYGARDRRNTQDEGWASTTMPLLDLINGFPATADAPAFGLTRHPVGKNKAGACMVLGSSVGGARKAKAMDEMFFMGLDIDSGASLDHLKTVLRERGLFCCLHTSFNHGKSGLQLKRDEVLRKLKIKADPSLDEIRQYLRDHDKARYEESFIGQVTIRTAKKQVKDGVVIDLDTPPLDKVRLIFPLLEPVKLVDLAETQEEALAIWEDAVTGLAHKVLGVHFDTSCTDPSRLFFTPRHPADGAWYSAVMQGDLLDFNAIPRMRKSTYTRNREVNNFVIAGEGTEAVDPVPTVLLPSGGMLNTWDADFGRRAFMLADLLETHCADRIRRSGSEKTGHVHTECPFEHEHSSEGGTATMAINAIDCSHDVWTWFCHHDACQGRHRLEMLGEALARNWFDEALLTADEFLAERPDEIDEDAEEERRSAAAGSPAAGPRSPEDLLADLGETPSEADLRKLIKRLVKRQTDSVARVAINKSIKAVTGLSLHQINRFWADEAAEQRDKVRDRSSSLVPKVNETGFDGLVKYGQNCIDRANEEEPRVFHYMERAVIIRDDHQSNARIRFLDRDGFAHLLNTVARFERMVTDTKAIAVSAPDDVVRHLYAGDPGEYPPLRGLVTSPIFSAKGQLILTRGYDVGSGLYYRPNHHLTVPPVSAAPTEDEVAEARRLLVEEVFADFPLGAKTRVEIVDEALHGAGIPAAANLMAMTLLPFCREMIDGPTPGHLLTKPAPGTGASLLTDVVSIIATGEVTPAMAMPANKEEMGKTLTSVLANGQNIVFFDNISHSVDSGELASAMTAKSYSARILGKTQTMNCEVRCVWVLTGNNVTLSNELVRRLVMIDLDARLSSPEKRSGFRHADIRSWVDHNRGLLVWACLTLIQNWIARGRIEEPAEILASYEAWSRIMGGILRDAGIGGFMGNRAKLRAASEEDTDEFKVLLECWWKEFGTQPLVVYDPDEKGDTINTMAARHEIILPVKRNTLSGDDVTYQPKALGSFLGQYRGRVFDLECGTSVVLTQGPRRARGFSWMLVPQTVPQSAAEAA